MSTKTEKKPPVDHQLVTVPARDTGQYEVLVERSDGHRSIHRLYADNEKAAVNAVDVPHGYKILASANAGAGLGSSHPGTEPT